MKKIALSAVLLVTTVVAIAQNLSDSLIVYYDFSGNTHDNSGNGFNATNVGATLVADRNGTPNSAYYFDGIDDLIQLPNISELKPDKPVTVSFWIKPESFDILENTYFNTDMTYNNYTGFWSGTAGSSGQIHFSFGDMSGGAGSGNRQSKVSSLSVSIGSWHHIVGVIRNTNDMDIYIDCVDAGGTYSGGASNNVNYSNNPGSIGSHPANSTTPQSYFWGTLDDFAFWNRALSPSEIMDVCNGAALSNNDALLELTVSVYNDQLSETVTFKFSQRRDVNLNFELFDLSGNLVSSAKVTSNVFDLNKGGLSRGLYHYRFTNDQGQFASGKIAL